MMETVSAGSELTPDAHVEAFGTDPLWAPFRELYARLVDAGCACTEDESCRDHELLDTVDKEIRAKLGRETASRMVVGRAGVPIDAYDAIQLLAARPDHPARLLAEKARVVADWVNDPPQGPAAVDHIRVVAPDLVEALFDLLAGGPGDVSDARPAPFVTAGEPS